MCPNIEQPVVTVKLFYCIGDLKEMPTPAGGDQMLCSRIVFVLLQWFTDVNPSFSLSLNTSNLRAVHTELIFAFHSTTWFFNVNMSQTDVLDHCTCLLYLLQYLADDKFKLKFLFIFYSTSHHVFNLKNAFILNGPLLISYPSTSSFDNLNIRS